jgi:magnesium-transporting ATPase (P-type)
MSAEAALAALESTADGLDPAEAAKRLERFGRNDLPRRKGRSFAGVYLSQFRSPLVYLLLAAAVVSVVIGEFADAAFIFAVLQINALIGSIQEWRAEKGAAALDALTPSRALVRRGGRRAIIDAPMLVPGDIIELESGGQVPADLRLVEAHELAADESLLTGESVPVIKDARAVVDAAAILAERRNLLHAGTTVMSGRAAGVVARTGAATEIGRIAAALAASEMPPPPLLNRLRRFSRLLGAGIIAAVAVVAAGEIIQGMPPEQVFFVAVALAVSAIPEGLPVAITVALAIATARMAKRRVIVRQLAAVEGLGACTLIASDKTGTLTRNELMVKRLFLPGLGEFEVTGEGYGATGEIAKDGRAIGGDAAAQEKLANLARAGALCNEASLYGAGESFVGDTVDVALLVLARKVGLERSELVDSQPRVAFIPFEPERRFAASFHRDAGAIRVYVKGAAEVVAPMCAADGTGVLAEAERLARSGYRVLAIAGGPAEAGEIADPSAAKLSGRLSFLGLVGIIDPVRAEVPAAIAQCRSAGIGVRMVTGDHPATALAIARELGIAEDGTEVVTGAQLYAMEREPERFEAAVHRAKVFARVEPAQKLSIVRSLRAGGEFVAVTGDGVNDAPALRAADIGVAMGQGGTDVARAAADLILADDNFASIVAGVEEGRIAYANVRKVVYLSLSTGAAEVVLFLLALMADFPIPLFAVQLLWLNLVTNGIQDVALAFEKGEPGILSAPPRPPRQPIIDRRMIEQTVISGLVIGVVGYLYFHWCMRQGIPDADARNQLLLLMVLFENVHLFNCRSETRSAFRIPFAANPFLILGLIGAQGVHIAAMYTPGLNGVLGIKPVALDQWGMVAAMALSVIVAMEIYKRVAAPRNAESGR